MTTVVQVGPYPPPLGGVSTHVQRLSRGLVEEGFDLEVVNHFGNSPDPIVVERLHRRAVLYWWRLRKLDASVVHYHHGGRILTLLAAAGARRRGTWIVTIHGHSLRTFLRSRLWPLREAVRWSLRRFDAVVAVSDDVARWLLEFEPGLDVIVVHPYIPPCAEDRDPADSELAGLLAGAARVMVMSAYRVVRWSRGGDLYGIDLAVDLLARLVREGNDVRLVLFLAQAPRGRWAHRHWCRIQTRANAPDLVGRLIVRIGKDLLPALEPGVLYLRPTRTDGDAVSVREALDLGVKVLASDVVQRPAGVRLVRADDLAAWMKAVDDEFDQPSGACRPSADQPVVRRIAELYRRLAPD